MENKELLEKEIGRELEKLRNLEQGTKEHSEATEALCKLMKMSDELKKGDLEREKFEENVKLSDRHEANDEIYHERSEERERKKILTDRLKLVTDVGIGLAGLGLNLAGICAYRRMFKQTLEFEETGSISSSAGKSLMQSLRNLIKR